MKNKTVLSIFPLILLFTSIAFAEVEVSLFTFGVEFKTKESKTWDFIRDDGMRLQPTDLLRVPPDAILRVKTEVGYVKIRAGQEGTVLQLINQAKLPKQSQKNGREIRYRILETEANATQTKGSIAPKSRPSLALAALSSLAVIDDNSLLENILGEVELSSENYPYRNFGYAKTIFEQLLKNIHLQEKTNQQPKSPEQTWEDRAGDEIDLAILYLALLREFKIKADLKACADGFLLILLESGFTRDQINRITVNPTLYQTTENAAAWLPIKFISQNSNFIISWYEGGRACLELSNQ